MKKNNFEKKEKKIYLPVSILVAYSLLLLIMVLANLILLLPRVMDTMTVDAKF